jgi:signal transduction histidine kinase
VTIRRRLLYLTAVIGLTVTVAWAGSNHGYFWPRWVWFGLAIPWIFYVAFRWGWGAASRRYLALDLALSAAAGLTCLLIWALSGGGYFWPFWPLLGLGVILAAHSLVLSPRSASRERELEERVGVLTSSRHSLLEIQEAELRRVERDLHDGAQARLVSLGISLGMAEEMMDVNPVEARRLLEDARQSAGAALADLRDLVRGIHPPVLADRGLEGAIRALVLTVPVPVEVTMQLNGVALPAPVESAVFFAVAETVTNVVKHSGASGAWICAECTNGRLSVSIGDDGHGGADPSQGTGLRGIERRLAAFDGTLSVVSPWGGPTLARVEVPCGPSSPRTLPS